MKILLILEPARKDWYTYLREDSENDYLLLWHENYIDIPAWVFEDKFFKNIYYWNEFVTSHQLLETIKADRIVFFEIIDQRQIALLVAANNQRIKTFYLEHGASSERETAIKEADQKNYFLAKKIEYLRNRFGSSFVSLFRSKYFYYSSAFKVNSIGSFIKYCLLPIKMLFNSPNKALANSKFAERTPGKSIVFNKSNYEVFELYTGINIDTAVFTGVPLFDKVYSSAKSSGDHVIFIDHPYLEEELMGWTPEFHKAVADALNEFSVSNSTKIIVRLHPRSSRTLWESYGYESSNFAISQNDDFTKEMLSSKLMLSFSSTLLTGMLCAKKNIVLLGWHPVPAISGFDFSKFGICHLSYHIGDLKSKYSFWLHNNLAVQDRVGYESYIKEINFPFDGNAAKRVLQTIVS